MHGRGDDEHRWKKTRPRSLLTRPRIGVLLSTLTDEYAATVLDGARRAAAVHGVHLLAFVGGDLDSSVRNDRQRNHIFSLVSSNNIDALVVLSGAIGNLCGLDPVA